jgi:hypothetical protein
MASSYDNDLRLNEMATGDGSGTWGTTTNTNLELIAEAFSYGTEVITTNADTHTTTIADGATDPGRSLYLKYTGTLDSACTITIAPNDISKVWIIENGTSGSQDIIISQGSGANITIPAGDTKVVYSDGAGAGAAFFDAFASLSVVDLKVQDDLTVTDDASIGGDATITGTLGVTGVFTGTSLDISGDIDVDGTTNLDVVDIDGALTQDGGAVFNETGADVDFRVESDTVDHALFVQGSDGNVGIGTSAPRESLEIQGTGNQVVSGRGNLFVSSGGTASQVAGHGGQIGFGAWLAGDYSVTYNMATIKGVTESSTTNINLGALVFSTRGSDVEERMRIDSSGNVGIGTTSPSRKLHISSSGTDCAIRLDNTVSGRPFLLAYDDSQNLTFTNSSDSGYIAFVNGTGAGTERVRIDSSGNLLVGGTTTSTIPTLNKGIYLVSSTDGDVIGYSLYANEGTNNRRASFFLDDSNGVYGFDTTASSGVCDFVVKSAATERMRIDSSGNVGIGLVPSYRLDVLNTTANVVLARFTTTATAAQSYGPAVVLTNDPNDTTRYFFAGTGGVTDRIKILSNGNIVNQNNSYTGISDEKLKENIVDAGSQWDDIKALRVRKYSFKEENASEPTQIGVIAQEVEAAGMSGLVYETADQDTAEDGSFVDTGEVTKTMKYSILYMKAVKALQEAMTRIETLEARITTLENA